MAAQLSTVPNPVPAKPKALRILNVVPKLVALIATPATKHITLLAPVIGQSRKLREIRAEIPIVAATMIDMGRFESRAGR